MGCSEVNPIIDTLFGQRGTFPGPKKSTGRERWKGRGACRVFSCTLCYVCYSSALKSKDHWDIRAEPQAKSALTCCHVINEKLFKMTSFFPFVHLCLSLQHRSQGKPPEGQKSSVPHPRMGSHLRVRRQLCCRNLGVLTPDLAVFITPPALHSC